ncbi:MAG: hypothetical protein VX834_03045 [Myxococcota bacterium]|nr:hypothetical protein [Myxococcota bacterium]
MLKKNWTILSALLLGCALVLAPVVASAGGIITHGRAYSQDGLAQDEEESDDDLTGNTKTRDQVELENELFLFTAFVLNSHEAIYAEAGTTEGGFLENSAEAGDQAGGCAQAPISGLSLLVGLGLLRRRRRS